MARVHGVVSPLVQGVNMPLVRKLARLPFGLAALTMLAFAAVASAAPSPADEKANRIAYDQIKDRTFTGVRGDGAQVVATFCADGRFESAVTDSSGTGTTKGKSWKVADATVNQGGRAITAFVTGTGGYEVGILRRGSQWKIGIASLGRVLEPGNVKRINGESACAAM
jgi:hypothetical protein